MKKIKNINIILKYWYYIIQYWKIKFLEIEIFRIDRVSLKKLKF